MSIIKRYSYALAAFMMVLLPSYVAYAGDTSHSEEAGAGGNFPQFDVSTYPSQLFWLTVSFIITYLILAHVALPKISYVLELRNAQREGNLAEAEKLNEEASVSLKEYEQVIAGAHDQVHTILQETKEDIVDLQNKEYTKFYDGTQTKLEVVEKNLQDAIDDALTEVDSYASELAQYATKHLSGVSISKSEATKIVSVVASNKTGELA